MRDKKAEADERDLGKNPLSEVELDELIGKRSHLEFLNSRNELYRARRMKEKPPTREQAIRLMAKEPNLIRRPIFRLGEKWIFGFDPDKLESVIK